MNPLQLSTFFPSPPGKSPYLAKIAHFQKSRWVSFAKVGFRRPPPRSWTDLPRSWTDPPRSWTDSPRFLDRPPGMFFIGCRMFSSGAPYLRCAWGAPRTPAKAPTGDPQAPPRGPWNRLRAPPHRRMTAKVPPWAPQADLSKCLLEGDPMDK